VFQDLAVQSKKGFNAFMQKLGGDKGDKEPGDSGFVMVGGGGKDDDGMGLQRRSTNRGIHGKGQETGAMRAVRAKREADDAGEFDLHHVVWGPKLIGIRQGVPERSLPPRVPQAQAGEGPGFGFDGGLSLPGGYGRRNSQADPTES
jgi:hypothetical protein